MMVCSTCLPGDEKLKELEDIIMAAGSHKILALVGMEANAHNLAWCSTNTNNRVCQESYGVDNSDALSCKTGCELSNFKNVQVPVLAEFSWSLFIDNGNSLQILQGEIPETDDVLTDPGLRSQVSRLESMRLPQVSLRTLPVQSSVDEMGPCGGLRVANLPYSYCLVWSLLLILLLFVLWSCLSLLDHPLQPLPTQEKLPLA